MRIRFYLILEVLCGMGAMFCLAGVLLGGRFPLRTMLGVPLAKWTGAFAAGMMLFSRLDRR